MNRRCLATVGLITAICAPQLAHADDTVDKDPPGPIKEIVSTAEDITDAYTSGKTIVEMVQLALSIVGALKPDSLSDEIKLLRTEIEAEIGAVSFQANRIAEDNWVALGVTAVDGATTALRTGMTLTADGVPFNYADQAVVGAAADAMFQRAYYKGALSNDIIALIGEPDHTGGLVYDWRLGLPVLMDLIGMQLQVFTAFDPNWKTDGEFSDRILRNRNWLKTNYARMLNGVRCSVWDTALGVNPDPSTYTHALSGFYGFELICADINSGMSIVDKSISWASVDAIPGGPAAGYPQTIYPRLDTMKRELLARMPLFETRSMIDTLYLYANPGFADLTIPQRSGSGPITLRVNRGLCLDVKSGLTAPGTPVWIYGCNGTGAQQWNYDRITKEVRYTKGGLCLDVSTGSPKAGTPVQVYTCNGTNSQHWTYDLEKGVLQNALNTVLDVQYGNLVAQTPVWAWDRNETNAQSWVPGVL